MERPFPVSSSGLSGVLAAERPELGASLQVSGRLAFSRFPAISRPACPAMEGEQRVSREAGLPPKGRRPRSQPRARPGACAAAPPHIPRVTAQARLPDFLPGAALESSAQRTCTLGCDCSKHERFHEHSPTRSQAGDKRLSAVSGGADGEHPSWSQAAAQGSRAAWRPGETPSICLVLFRVCVHCDHITSVYTGRAGCTAAISQGAGGPSL